jgi:hypothetical protein
MEPGAFWAAISAMAAVLALAAAIAAHINERVKDRRQRHVESMLEFAGDFYADKQMTSVFLKIQSGRLTCRGISMPGSLDELALAHLLEYLNAVGIALERKLITLNAIAATSISYIVLTTSRNEAVSYYLAHTKDLHREHCIPSPGWAQFEYLAQRLAIYASKHSGTPDLRPWYSQILSPARGWHWYQVRKIEGTKFDWRSLERRGTSQKR